MPSALIVAGPTASGKSALAMMFAEALGGTIVNADSMQTYRELRVLTARPTHEDEARVPHYLYGVRRAADAGNAAWWRKAALDAMDAVHAQGRVPILTGGTGMYLAALTQGLADIPDPGEAARSEARRLVAEGAEVLHSSLARVDPATAARIRPSDAQRVARAWEVWRGTGFGLAAWQHRKLPPAPWRFFAVRLNPPRDALRSAIATRFKSMIDAGVVEEVQALLKLDLDPSLPIMRAHGVAELSAYLRGTMSLTDASGRVELITGQYTRRQATWFRHHSLTQTHSEEIIESRFTENSQYHESLTQKIFAFIQMQD